MGIDSMRVSGGRCPPIVVVGLLIACLMLSFNWWTLSTENFEFVRQIDELNEQLKISTEERDQCIILRENLDQRYKHVEDEVGSLHVQLDKLNEIKKKNNELEESLTICKSELDSIKKLDASKNIALESWKVEKESLNSKLDAKQEEIQKLQDTLDQVTKELENLKLSYNAPSTKEKEQLNLKPAETNLEPKINDTISKPVIKNVETSKDIENHGDDGLNEEEEMEDNDRERQMKGPDTTEKIDETNK